MKVELVKPQGYCAGVLNAINTAKKAKEEHPNKDVYVLGMLVHNQNVINFLSNIGIVTLYLTNNGELPETLKAGDVVIFTAHGHDKKLDELAIKKGLIIYDSTCPIVRKNLDLIQSEISNNKKVIYIGQKNHKETQAALAISSNVSLYDTSDGFDYTKFTEKAPLVVNQTTLNFLSLKNIHDEIKSHIPEARILNEICAATRLRQEAVLNISNDTDLIIVVGDKLSSNSLKLFEIANNKFKDKKVLMIQNLDELKEYDLSKYKKATIASGASTPSEVVDEINKYLLNNFR